MKIAVASVNKNEDSEISMRGGRSPYYLLFNENAEFLEAVSNPFAVGGGGAGIAAAKMLADLGADYVISGDIGPKMSSALSERNVKYCEIQGKIKVSLEKFLKELNEKN